LDQQTLKRASGDRRLVRPSRAFLVLLTFAVPFLSGCQVTYLVKSAYFQASMLNKREPIDKALENPALSDENKRKLRLAKEAREFAEKNLGLKHTDNYTSFVQLDRPYVTYVVAASSRTELKAYKWWFPIVGSLPYKGFFNPEEAKAEAEALKARGYDTYTRGVSAYSTLGWFNDPILSSMLQYKDIDLVDTIIHETTHATIYIKSEADFNERLAVFFGGKGAEEFYRAREGANSPTLKKAENDLHDEKLFMDFMSKETRALEDWYTARKDVGIDETERRLRIGEIQARFASELRPQFASADSYKSFEKTELNNARLLNFRMYFEKLDDFEDVFKKLGSDFHKMLDYCKTLEGVKDPKAELAKMAVAP
jgi:predicted aminopeptidase